MDSLSNNNIPSMQASNLSSTETAEKGITPSVGLPDVADVVDKVLEMADDGAGGWDINQCFELLSKVSDTVPTTTPTPDSGNVSSTSANIAELFPTDTSILPSLQPLKSTQRTVTTVQAKESPDEDVVFMGQSFKPVSSASSFSATAVSNQSTSEAVNNAVSSHHYTAPQSYIISRTPSSSIPVHSTTINKQTFSQYPRARVSIIRPTNLNEQRYRTPQPNISRTESDVFFNRLIRRPAMNIRPFQLTPHNERGRSPLRGMSVAPRIIHVPSAPSIHMNQDRNPVFGNMPRKSSLLVYPHGSPSPQHLRLPSPQFRYSAGQVSNQLDDDLVEEEAEHLEQAEAYVTYVPAKLRMGLPHPDPVVESSTLNSVEPPDINYQLNLPEDVIDNGNLSSLQLEGVVYACQRHEKRLANGERAGFLIGDGAGVGKGRILAAIILENWNRGKKRFIWLSVSNDLKEDAERDLADLNASYIKVYSLNRLKYGKINGSINNHIRKGVIFATYASLIGQSTTNPKKNNRLRQLVRWFRKKEDGVIIIDECHRAKNLGIGYSENDANGTGSVAEKANYASSRTGLVLQELLRKCPEARVVYASATGATEPRHLAYMSRLGLWNSKKKTVKHKAGISATETDNSLTPSTFDQFMRTIMKGGVLAMEMVAMSMKASGMYCARQLSFRDVHFDVMEVFINAVRTPSGCEFGAMYDEAALLWQDIHTLFIHALAVLGPEAEFRKTALKQFGSAHQRFFKYLCISAKVERCVALTKQAIRNDNCVVIGLQSTGEARTQDLVDEANGEVQDFVSTSLGVLQNFLNKYFPTRTHVQEFLKGVENRKSANRKEGGAGRMKRSQSSANKLAAASGPGEAFMVAFGEDKVRDILSGKASYEKNKKKYKDSDDSASGEEDDDDDDDDDDDKDLQDDDDDDDDDDSEPLWPMTAQPRKRKKQRRLAKSNGKKLKTSRSAGDVPSMGKKKKKSGMSDSDDDLSSDDSDKWDLDEMYDDDFFAKPALHSSRPSPDDYGFDGDDSGLVTTSSSSSYRLQGPSTSEKRRADHTNMLSDSSGIPPLPSVPNEADQAQWSAAERNKYCEQLLAHLRGRVEKLSPHLPVNTLDALIDQLGGASEVAEMTGRKYRIEMTDRGDYELKNRCSDDTTMENINLHEKELFMNGEKLVAIISEAASSGISLQADRRKPNKRQRLHITLELPWSADRAVQQFGRTHRSNQCVPPRYIFLISDMPGERRFATTIAQRLRSMGALTQGDRHVTETRGDLCTTFHIDEQVGREAVKEVLQNLEGMWVRASCPPMGGFPGTPIFMKPPPDWPEIAPDFLRDLHQNLEGVGLLTNEGSFNRDAFQVNKFFNRLLGMTISVQHQLYQLFVSTLDRMTEQARREGRLDRGIMDLNVSVTNLKLVEMRKFYLFTNESIDDITLELLTMTAERGFSWDAAVQLYLKTKKQNPDDPPSSTTWGFFIEKRPNGVKLPLLALKASTSRSASSKAMGEERFIIYRPMEGRLQRKRERSDFEKYDFVSNDSLDEVEKAWKQFYEATVKQCYHYFCRITCPHPIKHGLPAAAVRPTNGTNATEETFQGCLKYSRLRQYRVLTGGALLQLWTSVDETLRDKLKQYVRFRLGTENICEGVLGADTMMKLQSSGQYTSGISQREYRGIGVVIPQEVLPLVMRFLRPVDQVVRKPITNVFTQSEMQRSASVIPTKSMYFPSAGGGGPRIPPGYHSPFMNGAGMQQQRVQRVSMSPNNRSPMMHTRMSAADSYHFRARASPMGLPNNRRPTVPANLNGRRLSSSSTYTHPHYTHNVVTHHRTGARLNVPRHSASTQQFLHQSYSQTPLRRQLQSYGSNQTTYAPIPDDPPTEMQFFFADES